MNEGLILCSHRANCCNVFIWNIYQGEQSILKTVKIWCHVALFVYMFVNISWNRKRPPKQHFLEQHHLRQGGIHVAEQLWFAWHSAVWKQTTPARKKQQYCNFGSWHKVIGCEPDLSVIVIILFLNHGISSWFSFPSLTSSCKTISLLSPCLTLAWPMTNWPICLFSSVSVCRL